MWRRVSGQWAYYLRVALLCVALTQGLQPCGSAQAADTGDLWTLSVSLTLKGIYHRGLPVEEHRDVHIDFACQVETSAFTMLDSDLPLWYEGIKNLHMQSLDSISGTYFEYSWECCLPNDTECCPVILDAKLRHGEGISSEILINVGKDTGYPPGEKNLFVFSIQVFPNMWASGSWDPNGCCRCCDADFPVMHGYIVQDNNCAGYFKGIMFSIDYDSLTKFKRFSENRQVTLNADCLRSAGWSDATDEAILTYTADLVIDVKDYLPFKPKPIKPGAKGAIKLLLLDD